MAMAMAMAMERRGRVSGSGLVIHQISLWGRE